MRDEEKKRQRRFPAAQGDLPETICDIGDIDFCGYFRGLDAAVCQQIIQVLETFGLPTSTEFEAEDLYAYTLSDKKRSGGTVKLIVPKALGQCEIVPVSVDALKNWIKAGL